MRSQNRKEAPPEDAFKKTRIVATLGPACDGPGVIRQMILEGVNVFRLNFSHGKPEDHARRVRAVREEARSAGAMVSILQDISGPKIRIGDLDPRVIELRTGGHLRLTMHGKSGNSKVIPVNYPGLTRDVHRGDFLYLADGVIEVEVLSTSKETVECRVLNGGRLSSHQGINFPGGTLKAGILTPKDREDLNTGIRLGVDIVALSFVRERDDVLRARELLAKGGSSRTPLIAKIEKHEALKNLESILEVSQGVMVARGDLGVEIPLEEVPLAQKRIIAAARRVGRPVIVATHMLASMVNRPRPTRAEVSDITTAVLDGADALMLSEETAVGHYPVESVAIMAKIIRAAEKNIDFARFLRETPVGDSVSDAISQAACVIAADLHARAIITPTAGGSTAMRVSRFRPGQAIFALSHNPQILRLLNLYWGVVPIEIGRAEVLDELFKICLSTARAQPGVKRNDVMVVTAGVPLNEAGSTNLIKVSKIF